MVNRSAGHARTVVLVIGVVYLVLAVAGFVRTGFDNFGPEAPTTLFGLLGVSTISSICHLVAGLVATFTAWRGAPSVFAVVGTVAFVAAAAFGVVSRVFPGEADPMNLTWWNVGLYVLTALACLYAYRLTLRVDAGQEAGVSR